jgi:hypothetical protein
MTNDKVVYERSDYTLLQFLGDVSALYGAAYMIAHFLAFTVLQTGVLLENHLINGIFRSREVKDRTSHISHTFENWLMSISLIMCRKRSRYRDFTKIGIRRLDSHLDIVHLVRKQVQIWSLIK